LSVCPNTNSNTLNNAKDLNGVFNSPDSPEKTWFSIIPRDSCDSTSVGNNPARYGASFKP